MTIHLNTSLLYKLGSNGRAIVVASLLAVLTLTACGADKTDVRSPVVRPVRVLTIGLENASSTQDFPGSVTAAQQSDMAFEVPGRIVDMLVSEGDAVAEGTVLALSLIHI